MVPLPGISTKDAELGCDAKKLVSFSRAMLDICCDWYFSIDASLDLAT
jgi:hypothetical protein